MELFGRTLGAEEITGLVFMLGALGIWGNALRGQMRERRWIKRRQAELKGERGAPKGKDHGGPWG